MPAPPAGKDLFHCHALSEIPWFINIRPANESGMIGQQLERHDVQNGREHAVIFRQTNDVNSFFRSDVAIPIGKNIKLAPSGTDLLHVAFKLLQKPIIRRDRYNRHILIHECQWAVL